MLSGELTGWFLWRICQSDRSLTLVGSGGSRPKGGSLAFALQARDGTKLSQMIVEHERK